MLNIRFIQIQMLYVAKRMGKPYVLRLLCLLGVFKLYQRSESLDIFLSEYSNEDDLLDEGAAMGDDNPPSSAPISSEVKPVADDKPSKEQTSTEVGFVFLMY